MSGQGVVPFSFATSRRAKVGAALIVLPLGALFGAAFWWGGVWDDWRMVLGWLPANREINKVLLVVPWVFMAPLVLFPLLLLGRAVLGDGRRPLALFFDNEGGRVLISETRAAPPSDRNELEALSGYRYDQIQGFETTTYTTTSQGGSNGRTRTTVHYLAGFRKTDGSFWPLEDFLEPADAQALVSRLETQVDLKTPRAWAPRPAAALPAALFRREIGSDLFYAWKGRVAFGTAFGFLAGGAGLAGFSGLLAERGLPLEPLLILLGFAAILVVMGGLLLFSSLRKSFRAHALRITSDALESGTLPLGLIRNGDGAGVGGRFRPKKKWLLADVAGVSALFSLEMRQRRTQALVVRGPIQGRSGSVQETLDIAGLNLSQTVDLEQALERDLNLRGARVR